MFKFKPTIIVDEFSEIVEKVSNELTATFKNIDSNISGVHYLHGHPVEIARTLSEKSQTNEFKFKKYPLIALLQDFPEKKNTIGQESEVSLHIIIVKGTDPNWKADRRYNENFRPFLYPVYIELLDQIMKHKKFITKSNESIDHTKIDRLFWGVSGEYGNTANIFMDHVDIIEIKDLKLKVRLDYC